MSLADDILRILLDTRLRYKGATVNMLGIPVSSYKTKTVYDTLYRLKRKKYATYESKVWKISKEGERHLKTRQARLATFDLSFEKNSPKNLLVVFDIIEQRKAEREWFRFHLRKFGYEMIQRSVWVGPSPLPKDFLEYLKGIKLYDSIKTFKLSRPYSVSK